jgi:hypothetical protein
MRPTYTDPNGNSQRTESIRVGESRRATLNFVVDVHLQKYSYDDAIRKYTSETAGYGTGYLLEHDYEELSGPFSTGICRLLAPAVKFISALNSLNCHLRWRSVGQVVGRAYQWHAENDRAIRHRHDN